MNTNNIYYQKIFGKFTKLTQNLVQEGNKVQRLLLEIADITDDSNLLELNPNGMPIIATQDYYFRVSDPMIASVSNESSPMAAPIVLFSLEGGSVGVKLHEKSWSNDTIEEIKIYRLHEAGVKDYAYVNTYSVVRIIATTELLINNNWFVVVMANVGTVKKEHKQFDVDGNNVGQVPSGYNFLAGTKG